VTTLSSKTGPAAGGVGFLLYDHLRLALPVFKYAIFGNEVLDEFLDSCLITPVTGVIRIQHT